MTTSVDIQQRFGADIAAVWALLSDVAYVIDKGERSGSIEVNAEVLDSDGRTVIISRRRLPAKLPGFARKFVGDEVVLTETQAWSAADESGLRQAEFVVDFGGQPMSYSGNLRLAPDGSATTMQTTGSIKASVPFIGGKIESVALEWTQKYLRKEETVAAEWLNR